MNIVNTPESVRTFAGRTRPILDGIQSEAMTVSEVFSLQRHFIRYMGHVMNNGCEVRIVHDNELWRRETRLECSAPFIQSDAEYVNYPAELFPEGAEIRRTPAFVDLGDAVRMSEGVMHVVSRYMRLTHPRGIKITVSSVRQDHPSELHDAVVLALGVTQDGEVISRTWVTDGDRSTVVTEQDEIGWSSTLLQDSFRRAIGRTLKRLTGADE